ncbi:aminotransferase class V-fold PLP-dependent enzyme [Geodermatophilus sp. DSM 44513]|uniref:aminotransferase class V-fold PLP-dependent enzyme n=1 Tax=Geodermatophilus sp. DSM 44513 TaxID=1528104 RepID=UPI00127D9ABB|nr:aminotransferase class V-fold PLP-dependent enzyme [Geodermatophilus sp. DSM 44513]WNV75385.1 aminotransferase class V-fold PLP-dependent enzyme [Geodermatophilus sp. DSM 44513]
MPTVPVVPESPLVGGDVVVPVLDGGRRRYVDLDAAATTSASARVAAAVQEFLPWYSSVHRGAGAKSQVASARYEQARAALLAFVGADPATHVVLFPRNTTEALNTLAFRLDLRPDDVVLTTAVEHHANLLPWRRHARLRVVDVDARGTFTVEDVVAGLDRRPTPRVLAVTGASNVTGWVPDLAAIAAAARARGVFVAVDAAQLAPHRPIDLGALGVDALALSGHKAYAPFGTGALVVPRRLLAHGEPMLVGGGAVKAVSFDDVVWADAPDRDEAGSPNVLGAVALAAAADELRAGGWTGLLAHERALVAALDAELASVPGLQRLGPGSGDRLPVAAFTLAGVPHALLAARLSAEFAIGVRNGCFCAHPYMARLLALTEQEVTRFHRDARGADRHLLPGAVRASANRATRLEDVAALGAALREIAATPERAGGYAPDGHGGYAPDGHGGYAPRHGSPVAAAPGW